MTTHAYICDAVRTPFGRYGGALSSVRTDDLGAIPIKVDQEQFERYGIPDTSRAANAGVTATLWLRRQQPADTAGVARP